MWKKNGGVGLDGVGQNIDYSSSSSIKSEGRFASANASCQRCFVRADLNDNSDSMLRIWRGSLFQAMFYKRMNYQYHYIELHSLNSEGP